MYSTFALLGGRSRQRVTELLYHGDGAGLGLACNPQPPGLRRRQQQHLLRPHLGRGRIMDKKVAK